MYIYMYIYVCIYIYIHAYICRKVMSATGPDPPQAMRAFYTNDLQHSHERQARKDKACVKCVSHSPSP